MVANDGLVARPSIARAALSPTALANTAACLAMLACLFLALYELGSSSGPSQPTGPLRAVLKPTDVQGCRALLYLWPFLFALCTLLVTVLLVILRPSWHDRLLLALPISFAIGLCVGWVLILFSDTDQSRAAMLLAALVAPPGMLVALRMMWLLRTGEMVFAAAWGQGFLCVLAVFSLRWLFVIPIDRLLWGGWLSMIAAGLMMMASWTWGYRVQHDLHDRKIPPQPMQISLRQIVVAITVTAIALTYWITFAGSD